MSSLMVSSDLDIMMLEFAVEKLIVPKISIFDDVIMKKTTVMFRMLDLDWTAVNPHRTDNAQYRGSNLEEEHFHGGKSIVFAMPSASLEKEITDIDVQIHVRKNTSKYFEMDSCQNVGIAMINVDNLFNGIIKELREREELEEYLNGFHKRQPISRSLKGWYEMLNEEQRITGASIEVYVRLSYFGKSIITEIDRISGLHGAFYVQEETNEGYPYQCKELKRWQLESGCWGSETFPSAVRPDQLACHCDTQDDLYYAEQTDDRSDYSDDEKSDRRKSSTGKDVRRSTDGNVRRSNGDRAGKGKSIGKKRRDTSEIVENDRGTEDTKKKSTIKGKRNEKSVKGGDVEAHVARDIHSDRMEMLKDESKSRKDVYNRGTDVVKKNVRKKAKEGGSPSIDIKGGKKSTDDEGNTGKRVKGQVGNGRKIGETKEAYTNEKRAKKRMRDGINGAPRKLEEVESVKDAGAKEDSKDRKPLGESGDRATGTTAVDGVGVAEHPIEAKQTLVDAGGSASTSEYIKRREQLRKRRRGIVTVGFDDKEKKICREAPSSPLPEPIPSDSIPRELCSDLHYRLPCLYPWPNNPIMYFSNACFMDTRLEQSEKMFTKSNSENIPELAILTN